MARILLLCAVAAATLASVRPALSLDRPWISDVFFYWYTWDYDKEMGSWIGGVYNTPLLGYYDSRTHRDNYQSLWMASEWGITHHFMDYWGHPWLDEHGQPREKTVMRAAEDLRHAGYDIWMAYYQDGTNFAMDEFAKNISEKRDVHQWLRDYAASPAWPRLHGRPFQLVYGRNGAPLPTDDDAGFRAYLREKYGTLGRLNETWGTEFGSLNDIGLAYGRGWQRAESINYQYQVWQRKWAQMDDLVAREFPYPGVAASFDVGYTPFLGYAYGDFTRVFGGPHSYAGIFDRPETLDVERFCQSMVAKHYDSVFFDHFKNCYCDWNTLGRVPGTCYFPEPHHFDRFWVGALMRYSEALLHLSWNEWWEGSNLEPCFEYGKKYCERNLLYSTLMQHCFESIRTAGRDAKVGVLLNDWNFKYGSPHPEDMYAVVQELRRMMVPFDLVPDDFVTEEELARFSLVIAPGCEVGFGYNLRGQSIAQLLRQWVEGEKGRKLLISAAPDMWEYAGLKKWAPPAGEAEPGPDVSVFVDIGDEGDEGFLVEGFSHREDWGALPEGAFGATEGRHTVRWTPAVGNAFAVMLPVSPHRDHVLRFEGDAIWPNTVKIFLDGQMVEKLEIAAGREQYEVSVPAELVGNRRVAEFRWLYAESNVPQEIDPARFPAERRVTNLGMAWIQLSTANLPLSQKQQYEMPTEQVSFEAEMFEDAGLMGKTVTVPQVRHIPFSADQGRVLSRYAADGALRDLLLNKGGGELIYANGLSAGMPEGYLSSLVEAWAGIHPGTTIEAGDVRGAELRAGESQVVLAYNYEPGSERSIRVRVPAGGRTVAEVMALSADGRLFQRVDWHHNQEKDLIWFDQPVKYFGVCSVVFSPVRLSIPSLVLHPGEQRVFTIEVENLTDEPQAGSVTLAAVVPTLRLEADPEGIPFALEPRKKVKLDLPLRAAETCDWGRKTVALVANVGGRESYFWRPLRVDRNPDLQLVSPLIDGANPVVAIRNAESPYIGTGTASDVTVRIDDAEVLIGDIAEGKIGRAELPLAPAATHPPEMIEKKLVVRCNLWGKTVEQEHTVQLAVPPAAYARLPDARAAITVSNPHSWHLENWAVELPLTDELRSLASVHVRDAAGRPVPSQVDFGRTLVFLANLPPKSSQAYYLCQGFPPVNWTDLRVKPDLIGTGKGALTIANSYFTLVLDETAGGTVTSFRSAATGSDYGARSFGAACGEWAKHDPQRPAQKATEYIRESKTYQESGSGRVRLVAAGPVRVIADAEWRTRELEARQRYTVYAYADHFRLDATADPDYYRGQEMVVINARLARNGLTKIFPNFSGMSTDFDKEQPHFGWREADYVPPYATFMTPPLYGESVSLLILDRQRIDRWRQGFWPERRPNPGVCVYAQAELISESDSQPASASILVRLHPGHQPIGRNLLDRVTNPPKAAFAKAPKWHDAPPGLAAQTRPFDPTWWNGYWHHRLPLTVLAGDVDCEEAVVATTVDFDALLKTAGVAGELDLDSIRLLTVDAD
ncbi:hypothetical protein AMK68_05090, partial [candidate division KD3-62 bacterium DG_56]